MGRRHRSRVIPHGVLAVGLACAPLVGCYQPAPEPAYYSAPPPPRALRITAQRKQSQRQQDRDSLDCQSMASGQATSSDTWAQIFTACMGGRGYMVE
jgi:hypothetical protein